MTRWCSLLSLGAYVEFQPSNHRVLKKAWNYYCLGSTFQHSRRVSIAMARYIICKYSKLIFIGQCLHLFLRTTLIAGVFVSICSFSFVFPLELRLIIPPPYAAFVNIMACGVYRRTRKGIIRESEISTSAIECAGVPAARAIMFKTSADATGPLHNSHHVETDSIISIRRGLVWNEYVLTLYVILIPRSYHFLLLPLPYLFTLKETYLYMYMHTKFHSQFPRSSSLWHPLLAMQVHVSQFGKYCHICSLKQAVCRAHCGLPLKSFLFLAHKARSHLSTFHQSVAATLKRLSLRLWKPRIGSSTSVCHLLGNLTLVL